MNSQMIEIFFLSWKHISEIVYVESEDSEQALTTVSYQI
jgi:hypothetical protein